MRFAVLYKVNNHAGHQCCITIRFTVTVASAIASTVVFCELRLQKVALVQIDDNVDAARVSQCKATDETHQRGGPEALVGGAGEGREGRAGVLDLRKQQYSW